MSNTAINPYLQAWAGMDKHNDLMLFKSRRKLVAQYAWAIPCDTAIQTIAKLSPIVEVGAGTGYWASLIAKAGAKIDCYDLKPPMIGANTYGHTQQYYPVMPIAWLDWSKTQRKTLFLCWPPYDDPMAEDCLRRFRGMTVVYVGESHWGCTATDAFHTTLDNEWAHVEAVIIPRWDGISDWLRVYQR